MKLLHKMHPIPNFGYDLNTQLWSALVPELFDSHSCVGFFGAGPLIGQAFEPVDRLHVLSSGVGRGRISLPSEDTTFWCVRGPITGQALGLDPSRIVTDAAILAPLVWPAAKRKQQVVVIPHWLSLHGRYAHWYEACSIAGFKLVSPMQSIEKALEDISSASLVLTECVYGAILADAYSVPWKAWSCTANFPLIEWKDWTGSMQLPLFVSGVAAPTVSLVRQYGQPHVCKGRLDQIVLDNEVYRVLEGMTDILMTRDRSKPVRQYAVQHIALSESIGSHFMGYRPSETAKHLFAVASAAQPCLSDEDHRERCRTRLLDLFEAMLASEGRRAAMSSLQHMAAHPA